MDKEIYKVQPIVLYPKCFIETGKQNDCHTCDNKEVCMTYQPRSMCIRPYKDHKNGCPNFGKLPSCPPNNPCMYDQLFDVSDVYAVVTKFYLEEFFRKRREKRPDLPEGQIRNSRIWQPITKKENDYAISEFYMEHPELSNYVSTRLLECMGVDVVNTMKQVGIELKFPPGDVVYRISFVAKVYEDILKQYGFEIHEENNKMKKGVRTLVKKNTWNNN